MRHTNLRVIRHMQFVIARYCLRSPKFLLLGITFLLLGTSATAYALTTISQSYSTDKKLSIGSIVSLTDDSSDTVVAASTTNVDNLFGVVVNADSSLLTVSNRHGTQAQVATSGIASVLVSDMNGEIHKGDSITASPFEGLGMKATTNTKIIGVAQGDPRNDTKNIQSYTDAEGNKQNVTLGEVSAAINAAYYFKQPDKSIVPAAIQKVANALAGKKVDAIPILLAVAVFIITLVVVIIIIYSTVRSSIISVGRNPMSQSAVFRVVVQMSALVLGILAVALVVIYLILTRL